MILFGVLLILYSVLSITGITATRINSTESHVAATTKIDKAAGIIITIVTIANNHTSYNYIYKHQAIM